MNSLLIGTVSRSKISLNAPSVKSCRFLWCSASMKSLKPSVLKKLKGVERKQYGVSTNASMPFLSRSCHRRQQLVYSTNRLLSTFKANGGGSGSSAYSYSPWMYSVGLLAAIGATWFSRSTVKEFLISKAKGLKMLLVPEPNCDVPEPWQLGFQDPASPIMQRSIAFHDNVMFILCAITASVMFMIGRALTRKNYHKFLVHGSLLEAIWTAVPALILVPIALPSLHLLYSMDEIVNPPLTIKAVGHQWYWSYEYSDYQTETLAFDSYMVPSNELNKGDFRLAEVDNRIVVPINTHVRVVVTAADVIHSFAVPSLNVKMDAFPGRLNQTSFFADRPGVFYGQCSEICGANHSFMPIVVEAVSPEKYVEWVLEGV